MQLLSNRTSNNLLINLDNQLRSTLFLKVNNFVCLFDQDCQFQTFFLSNYQKKNKFFFLTFKRINNHKLNVKI